MEYISKYVICPFYIQSGKRDIKCEGLTQGSITQTFDTVTDTKAFLKQHCCNTYKDCQIEKILEKKYVDKVT